MDHKIICPYCFREFDDSKVIFRANTGYTSDQIQDMQINFSYSNPEKIEDMKLFVKYDSNFKVDEALTMYWQTRGGEGGYLKADPSWNMPHIDPADKKNFRKMLLDKPMPHVGNDGFERDEDGFVKRVYDKFSDPLIPMTRLCPHCHNPLPLYDYGKYPQIFISIVGITTAGKTVFLNQLLSNLATTMYKTGYYIGVSNLHTLGEKVEQGSPLPDSTDSSIMRRPLAISMHNLNDDSDGFTLVFYDIAGENCVKTKNPDTAKLDEQALREGIGNFIAYCDALLFLVDPEQIPGFWTGERRVDKIREVIDVVLDIRTAVAGSGLWTDVPVAVVLTKSDLLEDKPALKGTPIFEHIDPKVEGFGKEDFFKIHNCLKNYFDNNVQTITASLAPFTMKAFCAVSAITCGVEKRFMLHRNQYILEKSCERKIKELGNWVRDWNSRTPEDRKYCSECPITARDGSRIEFGYDEAITEANSKDIETEIYADPVHGKRVYLGFWQIASGRQINLVGYPSAHPNPRRVEEPLKWILWRLKKIKPYYLRAEEPSKKWWETHKKYETRIQKWNDAENENEERFYEGSDLNEG